MRKPWLGEVKYLVQIMWPIISRTLFQIQTLLRQTASNTWRLKTFLNKIAYLESYDFIILVTVPHIKQMTSPIQKLAFSFNSNIQITDNRKTLHCKHFMIGNKKAHKYLLMVINVNLFWVAKSLLTSDTYFLKHSP